MDPKPSRPAGQPNPVEGSLEFGLLVFDYRIWESHQRFNAGSSLSRVAFALHAAQRRIWAGQKNPARLCIAAQQGMHGAGNGTGAALRDVFI
jgi:hypothetical protein